MGGAGGDMLAGRQVMVPLLGHAWTGALQQGPCKLCGQSRPVAADTLDRRWIGVDNSPEAMRTMLHRVRHGTAPMGDFVGKQLSKKPAEPQLPFDPKHLGTTTPNRAHAIPDLTLYTSPDLPAFRER